MHLLKRTTIVLLLFAAACVNNKIKHPLKIDNAYVQSWTTAEGTSRGTHIEVKLMGRIQNSKILAIVYNKLQVTPIIKKQGDKLVVWADFEKGVEQVFEKPTFTKKRDMIIYSYRGKVYELAIEHFEPKATNYYPIK